MRDRPSQSARPGGPRRPRAGAAATSSAPRSSPARPAPRRAARQDRRRSGANGGGERGGTTRTSAPRPGGRFTGRAMILGVVLVALGLSYVIPLRTYLAQEAEIAELRAAQAAQRDRVNELEQQAALWADEDYVRIQARQRLYYGEPDEVLLLPVWDDDEPPPETEPEPAEASEPSGAWWDTLWTSIESANDPAAEPPDPGEDTN